ncbi:hypothetical protein P7H06_00145 [Paenibacillus larvae]|nr:hypothetical protein [Paenibacillus larvae]MDT2258301.1 hypothetical protein [Paenibacillus larvae]
MGNVKYREVDRAAKVGERIRIVDADPLPTQKKYSNGDEFLVEKAVNFGVVVERGGLDFYKREYVVLEPIEEPDEISDIKNEMERLTGELATLALRVSKLEEPKSPQEIRDEIVAKAKTDIEGLAINEYGYVHFIRHFTDSNPPFYRVRHFGASFAEYIVNRRKKTVVCLLRSAFKKEIYARGIAKCAPGDVFNSHIGRAIALRRALGLEVPAEYLSVPNPTEIREGDIVGYTHPLIPLVYAAEVVDHNSWFISGSRMYLGVDYARGRRIIDDSREEGALDAYLA